MPTSSFWKFGRTDIKKLKTESERLAKENQRLQTELSYLRQKDILKAEIKRAKKEKFYRSPTGRIYLGTASALKGLEEKAKSPETKRGLSRLQKDIERAWKKL